jgi:hypothetical protein
LNRYRGNKPTWKINQDRRSYEHIAGYFEFKLARTTEIGSIQRWNPPQLLNGRRDVFVLGIERVEGRFRLIVKEIRVLIASSERLIERSLET